MNADFTLERGCARSVSRSILNRLWLVSDTAALRSTGIRFGFYPCASVVKIFMK
jgi:hypothetical protein